jgi:hypothetical protein
MIDVMPGAVWIGIVVWHLAMYGLAAAGAFEQLTAGMPLLITLAYVIPMTAFFVVRRWPPVRDYLARVDLRVLMVLHSARWVGAGTLFVALYHLTSPKWALSVALGDMTAATALTYLAITGFQRGRLRRSAVRFWNLWGIVDFTHSLILAALFLPSKIGVLAGDLPQDNAALAVTFPFVLIPISVPILACTHLVILGRLRDAPDEIVF